MYPKAPSWSIKGKNFNEHLQMTPSPFQYHPEKFVIDKKQFCKIGTEKRDKITIDKNPGPTSYNPSPSTKSKKLGKFGNDSKLKHQFNDTPEPTLYAPNSNFIKPKAKGIKFQTGSWKEKQQLSPGPGSYHVSQKNIKYSNKSCIFKKEKRFMMNKTEGPSPGDYSPEKPPSCSMSFTKSPKIISAHFSRTNQLSPGPGNYNFTDLFTQSVLSKKGYSIQSRHCFNKLSDQPGPGSYNPFKNNFNSPPKQSFGIKYREAPKQNTPGPSDYEIRLDKQQSSYSIGKQRKGSFNTNQKSPGPGQYEEKHFFRNSPKYSIGNSTEINKENNFPGPCDYLPNKLYVKTRPKSAKIGKSQRDKAIKYTSPGPGAYNCSIMRPSSAKPVIGKASRLKITTQKTPGPGQYQSQSIFSKACR